MYRRLVTARRGAATTLWYPVLMVLVISAIYAVGVPPTWANPTAGHPWRDPHAVRFFIAVGTLAALGIVVFVLVHIAIGLGILAGVYGRSTRRGVVVAGPWGVVGYPSQRIRLEPGEVVVRLVSEVPYGRMYAYGMQRVYFSQGGRTLHTMSYVRYSPESRGRLVDWLTQHGISPVFEGADGVLPQGSATGA